MILLSIFLKCTACEITKKLLAIRSAAGENFGIVDVETVIVASLPRPQISQHRFTGRCARCPPRRYLILRYQTSSFQSLESNVSDLEFY